MNSCEVGWCVLGVLLPGLAALFVMLLWDGPRMYQSKVDEHGDTER